MDINPLQNYIRIESIQGTSSYQATTAASTHFSQMLSSVVSRQMVNVVQAQDKILKSVFQEKKSIIETGEGMQEEDEENESIYKTVRKIETKLIKLARLERQMMAGF